MLGRIIAFCAVFLLVFATAYDLEARRFGGSFKFKSSSSYAKPKWSGSRKPKAAPSRTAQNTRGAATTRNVSSAQARGSNLARTPTNHFSSTKQKAAYQNYQSQQQSKFQGRSITSKSKAASRPLYQKAARNARTSSGNYWDRRDNFYGGWNAPNYVYFGAPSYGMWDGFFLGYMLSHAMTPSYARLAYHHQHDPGMREWRTEMDTLAASNEELKAQLDALDAQVAELSGTAIDPTYLPAGVNADLVMPPDMVAELKPTFKLCTADKNGNYYAFGKLLEDQAGGQVNVEVVTTAGSMENLEGMQNGRCDGAFVQRNAFTTYADRNPDGAYNFERVSTPALEYAHLVCNRNSKVKAVGDLVGKSLLVGEEGSGTEVTWTEIVAVDDTYKEVSTRNVGGMSALQDVIAGRSDCMLYVASLNTQLMKQANNRGKELILVPVNDRNLDDKTYGEGVKFDGHIDQSGEQVYEFTDLPSEQYANIQDGFIFTQVKTLSVPVDMVASLEWKGQHPEVYNDLLAAVGGIQPSIDSLTDKR